MVKHKTQRLSARIFSRFEFQQWFFRFLLVDRIMIKKDNLVLITGKRGDGKTTLALKIIMGFRDIGVVEKEYNNEMNRKKETYSKYKLNIFTPFNLEKHMAFTRKALQDLCKSIAHGFILADEAIVNAARRNSMTRANKILHEVLTINRKNGNTVFFCLPSIEDFDISMLQYVTHWIHIDDRGLGCVMLPEAKSIFGRKSWDVDRMRKVYDKFKEEHPAVLSVPYWLFDNFRGYIRFRALSTKLEEKYLEIAHREKNKDTEENGENSNSKKSSKPSSSKLGILNEVVDKLLSGEISDSADYYAYCGKTELSKSKLNKEIAEILAQKGDGRNALRVVKENKDKQVRDAEKKALNKRVIY